jgi:hypothetical protein
MKERGNENDVEGKSYLEVNTLFLAERHDVCASLEWVEVDLAHRQSPGAHERLNSDTHLVHRRHLPWYVLQQLLHLPHPKRTDPHTPRHPFLSCLHTRLPALLPHLPSADRAMDEVQINIPQPTRREALMYGLSDAREAVVVLKLGGVEDVRARDRVFGAEVADGAPNLGLVFVPFSGIDVSVAGLCICQIMDDIADKATYPPRAPRSRRYSTPCLRAHMCLDQVRLVVSQICEVDVPKPRIGMLLPSFSYSSHV